MKPAGYPPARYCTECRRLDNSCAPRAMCCGVPTIPPPDYLAPSQASYWALARMRERNREAKARRA